MINHTCHIAGIPFRKPNLSLLAVGDEVFLVPEPDNKFDPNAIKVIHKSGWLGYIPKLETGQVSGVAQMFIHKIEPADKWNEVIIGTERPVESGFDEAH